MFILLSCTAQIFGVVKGAINKAKKTRVILWLDTTFTKKLVFQA